MGANASLSSVYGLTSGTRGGIMLKRRNKPKTCKCPRRPTLLPRPSSQFIHNRRSFKKPKGSTHANSWCVSVGPIRSNGANKLGPRGFCRTRQKARYTLTYSPMLMTAAGGVGNLLDLSSCYNDNGCVHASHGILMRGGIPSAILCARQRKISCTTHSRVKFARTSQSDRPCTCNHFCAERAWLPRGRFMAALDILKAVFRPRRRLILFLKVSASGAALRVAWVAVFPPSTFVTRSRNNNCAKTAILHKQL